MSKNLTVSLILVASLVMFVFGVCAADSAYAITEAQPEKCTGGCTVIDDDGACIDEDINNDCGGTVGNKPCDCHTHTEKITLKNTCVCGTA